MFESLTDTQLMEMLESQANACVRVMAMSETERSAAGRKGEASPEQAGALNAMLAMQAEREAARRGLVMPVLG